MKKENFTMKELPDSEKPYEKCERDGAKSLSNAKAPAVSFSRSITILNLSFILMVYVLLQLYMLFIGLQK